MCAQHTSGVASCVQALHVYYMYTMCILHVCLDQTVDEDFIVCNSEYLWIEVYTLCCRKQRYRQGATTHHTSGVTSPFTVFKALDQKHASLCDSKTAKSS